MRGVLAFIATVMVGTLHAQALLLMGSDTTYRSQSGYLAVHAEADFGSGVLTNRFLDKTYRGGFIGPVTKEEIQAELKDQNRVGGWFSTGLLYRSFGDTLFNLNDWGLEVGVESHVFGSALFSDDAFNLAFEGNGNALGQTLELDRNAARLMKYQKFGVGLFHREHFSGVRISAVNGQFFQDVVLDEASLYTSAAADTLILAYQGTYTQSDPNFAGAGNGNGVGVALDAVVNFPLEDDRGYFSLAVNNLGHIWWSESSETYSADSTFTWTGVNLGDITESTDLGLPALRDTVYHEYAQGRQQTWLPTSVRAAVMLKVDPQTFWEASLTVRPDGIHLPQAAIAYAHMPNANTLWRFTGRAGGYGQAGVGLSLEKRIGAAYLEVALPDLPGLVLQDLHGSGAYFRLGWFLQSDAQ